MKSDTQNVATVGYGCDVAILSVVHNARLMVKIRNCVVGDKLNDVNLLN